MSANVHPISGAYTPSPLHISTEVNTYVPLGQSSVSSSQLGDSDVSTPQEGETDSNIESYSSSMNDLSERLRQVDFTSPAKIFQSKHAIHQFENITPGDSNDTFSSQFTTSGSQTPKTPLTKNSDISTPQRINDQLISAAGSIITHIITPSQFVFKKPEYNSHYHHTHFHHHLEKKDTIFKDLKRLFIKKNGDKKKKSRLLEDMTSANSSGSSIYSKQSDLSFANEFNKDLEGRYGKWGKSSFCMLK
jgi:hypothetical protein